MAALSPNLVAALVGAGVIKAQGGGGQVVDFKFIPLLSQSNMTGGQTIATGATLIAADSSNLDKIKQWSPNGGLQAGDPAKTNVLLDATAPLLFPQGSQVENNVGPGQPFALAKLSELTGSQQFVLGTDGKGGTGLGEWVPGQPLYESMKTSWNAFKAYCTANGKTYSVPYILASLMENEMLNNSGSPSTVATMLDNWHTAIRALFGNEAPIIIGLPNPEWVISAPYRAILDEAAKFVVRTPNVGICGGIVGGNVPGDTVHRTNAANRTYGGDSGYMAGMPARIAADQVSAPPQVALPTLNAEQMSFVSVGAPYYTLEVSTDDFATFSSTIFTPNQKNAAGEVFTTTLPGTSGVTRKCRVRAYNYFCRNTGNNPSPAVTYTASSATVPARVVELDFHNAPVDGSGNITSVASIGSDTTAYTPVSTAGTGALATLKKVAQGSKNVLSVDSANKRLRRTGLFVPAGDYSFALPFFYGSTASNGVILAWGQASTLGDIQISLANSGVGIKVQHVNTTVAQVITTGTPLSGQTNKWHLLVVTYDRTNNVALIYLNGALLATSGTMTQRAASPANSGGTDIFGVNVDTSSNGFPSLKVPPIMGWSQVLTSDEIAALKTQLQTDYSLTFG